MRASVPAACRVGNRPAGFPRKGRKPRRVGARVSPGARRGAVYAAAGRGYVRPMLRSRITYANVVATLALFLALGTGGAFAVSKITGADVRNRSLTGAEFRSNSVGGRVVRECMCTFMCGMVRGNCSWTSRCRSRGSRAEPHGGGDMVEDGRAVRGGAFPGRAWERG